MPDRRPHVILFTTDQHRGDHLGLAGHPAVETPNVDSWIERGAYFPNAYTEIPSTTGARRCLHGHHLTDAEYEAGLRAYIRLLKELAPDAGLIWASSTPVRAADGSLNPQRNPQVVARNAIASRIMEEYRISIDDLYGLVADRPELFAADGVHYNDEGKTVLGESVTSRILQKREKSYHPVGIYRPSGNCSESPVPSISP